MGLPYHIYTRREDNTLRLIATTLYAEDAASIAEAFVGGVVKLNGRIVWDKRKDSNGGDSYDDSARLMRYRAKQHNLEYLQKQAIALKGA